MDSSSLSQEAQPVFQAQYAACSILQVRIPLASATEKGILAKDFFRNLGKFSEALSGRCVLENLSGIILEKVCEYLCYNEKNKNQTNVPDMDIPPELCLELLMAADYLDT